MKGRGHQWGCEWDLGQRTGALLGLTSVSYIARARGSNQLAVSTLPTCDYVASLDYNSQDSLLHGSHVLIQQVISRWAQILL